MSILINVFAEKKGLRILCAEHNIQLFFEEAFMPRTDMKGKVWLPKAILNPLIKDSHFDMLRYCIRHEIYHNKAIQKHFPEFVKEKEINMRAPSGMLYNILMDEGTDREGPEDNRGSIDICHNGRVTFYEEMSLPTMEKYLKDTSVHDNITHGMVFTSMWDTVQRVDWNKHLQHIADDFENAWIPRHKDYLREFERRDFKDRMRSAWDNPKTLPKGLWSIVEEMQEIFDIPDEKFGVTDDPKGGKKGDSDKNGEGTPTKSVGDGGEGESSENKELSQDLTVDYMDLLVSPHDNGREGVHISSDNNNKFKIDYSNWQQELDYAPYDSDKFDVEDLT